MTIPKWDPIPEYTLEELESIPSDMMISYEEEKEILDLYHHNKCRTLVEPLQNGRYLMNVLDELEFIPDNESDPTYGRYMSVGLPIVFISKGPKQ
jgi:hypothetical protein